MKTIKKYAALFCVLCTILAVSGCDNNLFEPTLPEGEGAVVLSIGGSAGRTIAPPNVGAIDKYEVKIYLHGGDAPEVEREWDGISSGLFFLRDGSYDFFIEGFVGDNLVAEGHQLSVAVAYNNGIAIPVHIELVPAISGGTGTFAWDLTFDDSVTAAMMQIGTRSPINVLESKIANESLPSNQYDVVFTLSYGTATVEWTERLHVYRNLTSTFIHTFEDLRLETLEYRVQTLIEAGTIAGSQITEQHLELLGIAGVDHENLAGVLSAIEWVINLKTSVDIALITNHVYVSSYTNIAQLKDIIIGAAKNGTITADDITVSGTTTFTATLTIDGKSFPITSGFTFDDRAITAIVLDTTGVQTDYLQYYHTNFSITGLKVTAKHEVGVDTEVDLSLVTITPTEVNLETVGPQVITVALTSQPSIRETYTITVIALDSISVTDALVTKDYYQFIPETVNLDNLVVKGHWGTTEHDVDYTDATGIDLAVNTAGPKTVTIDYHGKTETFNVTVHELDSIKLTGPAQLAEAPSEDNIKAAIAEHDITVTGTYANTQTRPLNAYVGDATVTVTPETTQVGSNADYTVKFVWKEVFVCEEYTFKYNDTTPIISSITISGNDKKFYQYFTDFSEEGIVVTAHWTQGQPSTIVTDAASFSFGSKTFNKNEHGTYDIEVTHTPTGHSTSYSIEVIAPDGITVVGEIGRAHV